MKNIRDHAVNTIRGLSIDQINKANSGHPGLPMGAAPMAYTLWANNMRHFPGNTDWISRDRFILSAGHGSALVYSLLHLFRYALPMDELRNFRQWGSRTPGHPEYRETPGVETTTGPLGQGIANAVGMEIAREHMSSLFDTEDISLFDNHTYVIAGDGCMMEGISSEACSLAGHLRLKNLIILYDDNNITIEGQTELAFSEDVEGRYRSYGFDVFRVVDGNDLSEIDNAVKQAKNSDRPSLIMVKTVIGHGSPNMAGKAKVHGSPLGEEEGRLTKENLGLDKEKEFYVSEEVREHFDSIYERLKDDYEKWLQKYDEYKEKYSEKYARLQRYLDDSFINSISLQKLARFEKDSMATREAVGVSLNRIAEVMPNFIGGSADLAPSTKTYLNDSDSFSAENRSGRNLHFGIREHAMGGIVNGITLFLSGRLRSYSATFLVFSDYMRHTLRLAALMKIPSIFIFTHDSIGVGEDGPTHQPIEHIMSLRLIPGLYVVRPADAKETAYFTHWALSSQRPVAMALTRQKLPVLTDVGSNCLKGAYILEDKDELKAVIIATGSEVNIALKAQETLAEQGINVRVVSMPCVSLFEEQEEKYRDEVLVPGLPKIVVEAGVSRGWERYCSSPDNTICVDVFGQSAPAEKIFDEFGINADSIIARVKDVVKLRSRD